MGVDALSVGADDFFLASMMRLDSGKPKAFADHPKVSGMAPGGKAKDEGGRSNALSDGFLRGASPWIQKASCNCRAPDRGYFLLKKVGRIEVNDAIFLAFVAEKPCGAVAVAAFFAAAFAAKFLKTAAMAKAPAEVVVHLVVGSNVDGIFETGAGAPQRFFLRHRLLSPLPSHGDNGGGDGGHEEKIDHKGTTTPERYDSRILHGRQQQ